MGTLSNSHGYSISMNSLYFIVGAQLVDSTEYTVGWKTVAYDKLFRRSASENWSRCGRGRRGCPRQGRRHNRRKVMKSSWWQARVAEDLSSQNCTRPEGRRSSFAVGFCAQRCARSGLGHESVWAEFAGRTSFMRVLCAFGLGCCA